MRKSFQWDVGTIQLTPPPNAPEGCPPAEITIGVVTVAWGEDRPRKLPPFVFQSRFTDSELAAIQLATDATTIRIRTAIQTIRDDIDLDAEDTRRFMAYLVASGFLTEGRAAEILS
jgi:hypothetical protein